MSKLFCIICVFVFLSSCQLQQTGVDLSSCSTEVSLFEDMSTTSNRQVSAGVGQFILLYEPITITQVSLKLLSENLTGMRIQIYQAQEYFFEEYTNPVVDFTHSQAITTTGYQTVSFNLPAAYELGKSPSDTGYGIYYFIAFKPTGGSFRVESRTSDRSREFLFKSRIISGSFWSEGSYDFFSMGITGQRPCR